MSVEELIKVLGKHRGKQIETLIIGLVVKTDNDQEDNALFAAVGTRYNLASVMSELVDKITSKEEEKYGQQTSHN